MKLKEEYFNDQIAVKEAFEHIQEYPMNAPAFFEDLTTRQRFMLSRLLTDYLYLTADIGSFEENLLMPLSPDDRQAVLRTLMTQQDPSLVSDLPLELDSVYMKIYLNTDENLRNFYAQYNTKLADAFNLYRQIKPDSERVDMRCYNLCKLLNSIVNEDVSPDAEEKPQKGLPPYIRVPSDEIRSTLDTLDYFERQERIGELRKELDTLKPVMIDSTWAGLQYRTEHKGKKLSETPEMKAKKLRQMKKERLIRKKLAAENKRLPQNKKRFSLNRILSTLNNRKDHSF